MGEVIVITSGKGGTGKSVISAYLARTLAAMGKKTAVVDLDFGLRTLDLLYGIEDAIFAHIVDLALGREETEEVAVEVPGCPGLSLIPAAPSGDASRISADQMRELMSRMREQFDYVILDSPAGVGAGFELACCAADQAVFVVTRDAVSARCGDRVRSLLAEAGIRQVSYIVNRFPAQAGIGEKSAPGMFSLAELEDLYGAAPLGVIPYDVTLTGTGETCCVLPGEKSLAGIELSNIARRICGEDVPYVKLSSKPGLFERVVRALRNES